MKLFKNKKGSVLVEKIMVAAFAVAMGGAVIVWTSNVIIESKNRNIGIQLGGPSYAGYIAEEDGTNGLIYEVEQNANLNNLKKWVSGYNGTASNVVIPSTYGTRMIVEGSNPGPRPYKVVGIKNNVFQGNTTITSVQTSSNLVRINASAFEGCSNLTSITISANLVEIGANAFKGTALSSIYIPNTTTYVGANAFQDCPSGLVINVNLPSAPNSWDANWNSGNHTVNWNSGATIPEDTGGTPVTPEEPPQTEYELWLINHGPQKMEVIKYVKNNFGLGLAAAKQLVESYPCCLKDGLSQSEAETHRAALAAIDATVEVR